MTQTKGILSILALLLQLSLHAQTSAQAYQKVHHQFGADAKVGDVQAWLLESQPILAQTKSSLQLSYHKQSPGGQHLTFQQSFQGEPIWDAFVKVNMMKDGRVLSVMQQLKEFEPNLLNAFRWEDEQVERQLSTQWENVKMKRYYDVEEMGLRAVYQAVVESFSPHQAFILLLDGESLREIERVDRRASHHHQHHHTEEDSTCLARVFMPDPCSVAGVPYGALFTDDNDQHSPLLESLMDTVVLRDLVYANGAYQLEGPHVRLLDIDTPTQPPASSVDGNFFFGRDESGFEDVMVYYHVDTFQRYIQALGFTNLVNYPLDFDPHAADNADNSFFTRGDPVEDSYILMGEGGVDDAEDADVIIHEYGHAISHWASFNTNQGFERRGLDESFGDYFAAIYSKSLNENAWDTIFNWDGHNPFWDGRVGNTTDLYPPSSNSFYRYGQVWTAVMLQIRAVVGEEVADRLLLQEMYANIPDMDFEDAAYLLLDADTMLYGGIHSPTIIYYMCERQILSGTICNAGVSSIEDELPKVEWRVMPNPSDQNGFTLELGAKERSLVAELWDITGRKLESHQVLGGEKARIGADLPKGMYIVHLLRDYERLDAKRLIVID